jgi:superoxide reductase
MAEKLQVYKCKSCGLIVGVLHASGAAPACCGKPMELCVENTVDAVKEKHVPVIEKTDKGYKVKVGSVPHPMIDTHYIEWIELLADGKVYRQDLKPGDAPEAEFQISASRVAAREYCNLHGLWNGQ